MPKNPALKYAIKKIQFENGKIPREVSRKQNNLSHPKLKRHDNLVVNAHSRSVGRWKMQVSNFNYLAQRHIYQRRLFPIGAELEEVKPPPSVTY